MLVFSHRDATWWETGDLASQLRDTRGSAEISSFTPLASREKFTSGVARIKDWIAAGHIYQANLSQAFAATVSGDLFSLYETLRDASPAPMAAYLALDGREILSSSPKWGHCSRINNPGIFEPAFNRPSCVVLPRPGKGVRRWQQVVSPVHAGSGRFLRRAIDDGQQCSSLIPLRIVE